MVGSGNFLNKHQLTFSIKGQIVYIWAFWLRSLCCKWSALHRNVKAAIDSTQTSECSCTSIRLY